MGRFTYIAVLTLLYLQWGDSATPIPKGDEYVYHYTGSVNARNSASNERSSQWTIAAELVMQSNGQDIVMKLKDIKTNLCNGQTDSEKDSPGLPIPQDAHQLHLPFVVHYYKNGSASSIMHQPEDPRWSVNMKRAIASIVQIDAEHAIGFDGQKFYEESIYGSCEADYSVVKIDSTKAVMKTINDCGCVNHLENNWSNLAGTSNMPKDFNPTSTVAIRTYVFVKKDDSYLLKHIESNANITYQTMQSEYSAQQLIQNQMFHLTKYSAITETIDVSKNTESTSLQYVFDENDDTSGRKEKKPVEDTKLLQDLKDYYTKFQTDMRKYPLVPGDLGFNNSLTQMFHTLYELNKMDVEKLGVVFDNDESFQNLFMSMLPYMGTKASIDLMRTAFESGRRLDSTMIKMLAIFPKYVNEYSPELLESLEVMMRMNHTNRHVRHAGITSFAAMVSEANTRIDIPQKQLEKYSSKYINNFKNAEEYDDQMTHLLGLINMGSILDSDAMISIIENKKHSHHLRSLAAYGFKPFLASNSEKMFERLWPIVQNKKVVFEVRVAVLDLLISADLKQQEFDTIINAFKEESKDLHQQHLQNYLASTISSLYNATLYSDNLSAQFSDALEQGSIPSYYDTWTTGNYRISYTDSAPNFGSYLQASLVANPVTNIPHIIQLSYNQFARSLNRGTYTAYIKLDGIADAVFTHRYFGDRPRNEITVPELIEIIRKFNYKQIDFEKIHLELVLFCDDRVVFGMHLIEESIPQFRRNRLFQDLMELLLKHDTVSYPELYEGHMRSDLGTPVKTYMLKTDFVSHELKIDQEEITETSVRTGEWNYRSWGYETIRLESYNPVADVNIAVYKFNSLGQRVHLPMSINVTGEYFIFEHVDDSYNFVFDKSVGLAVDDEQKLHTYCPHCDADFELFEQEVKKKSVDLDGLGIYFNVTLHKSVNDNALSVFHMLDEYRSNTRAMPLAESLLFYWYFLQYHYYLGPDSGGAAIRSMENHPFPTENVVEWEFDFGDVYNENDPINGSQIATALKFSCRKKENAEELATLGINYHFASVSASTGPQHVGHVEQTHTFRAEYAARDRRDIMCFDRELKYPDRRPDLLSISAVEPAKGTARFSLGTNNVSMECGNHVEITFSDIFEPAKDQMEAARSMEEYQQCKKDSVGLKWTPPTDACVQVHEAVSKYSNYTLYADFKKAGKLSKINEVLEAGDDGVKLLEYSHVHGDTVEVRISEEFMKALVAEQIERPNLLRFHASLGLFSGLENPATVAYDNYDTVIGISATCDITAKKLNTFTGAELEDYERKDGKETVAFVECFNETQSGLTIQKYGDKKIGFTMWSGDDKLVTSIADGKLSVALNGAKIHSQTSVDKHLKISFLQPDVLYITHEIFEMYYNTEYLSVKAPSMYNHYICGLCAQI